MDRRSVYYLLMTVAFLFFLPLGAFAHRPHDVIGRVALSPEFGRDQIIFIIVRGNLYKSINGGLSWKRVVNGIDNHFWLSSLEISPSDKKVVFLSTLGDGIYRSEDEGLSWARSNQGLKTLDISLVRASPHSGQVALAAAQSGGLYKTADGGDTWRAVLNPGIKVASIAFDPKDKALILLGSDRGNIYFLDIDKNAVVAEKALPVQDAVTALASITKEDKRIILAGTAHHGLYCSADSGATFSLAQGLTDPRITGIAFSDIQDKEFQVFVTTWHDGVFYSSDSGRTWLNSGKGLTRDPQADDPAEGGAHFGCLAVSRDFNQDHTAFVGGFNGLFKSTDGGKTWNEIETLSLHVIVALDVSADFSKDHSVIVAPYTGYPNISRDKGRRWGSYGLRKKIKDLFRIKEPLGRYFDIAFSPGYRRDHTVFATLLYDVLIRFEGPFRMKKSNLPALTRGTSLIFSPGFRDDRKLFVASQYGDFFIFEDGGSSLRSAGKLKSHDVNQALPCVISPNFQKDRAVYAAGAGGVYESVDLCRSWQLISGKAFCDNVIVQLAISPDFSADAKLFAVTVEGLFLSKDRGRNWQRLSVLRDDPRALILAFAVSPAFSRDRTILVSLKGKGLYRSTDAGDSFSQVGRALIDDNHELSKIYLLPSSGSPIKFSPDYERDRTIFGFGSAASEIYRSQDGGDTWEILPVSMEE